MARTQVAGAQSTIDVGALAFGRAPAQLGEVIQRLLRVLEDQGHSAEEREVDITVRAVPDSPLLRVEVALLAGECGTWWDVAIGHAGRPFRVWCDLEVFHDGEHRARRGDVVHTLAAA